MRRRQVGACVSGCHRDGAVRALWWRAGGAVPLLPVVCAAAAQEDRRVLLTASARRGEGAADHALPDGGPAHPLQRLERERCGGRRGVARRARGGARGALP